MKADPDQIRATMRSKTTVELIRLLTERDSSQWTDEAFAAAKHVLDDRSLRDKLEAALEVRSEWESANRMQQNDANTKIRARLERLQANFTRRRAFGPINRFLKFFSILLILFAGEYLLQSSRPNSYQDRDLTMASAGLILLAAGVTLVVLYTGSRLKRTVLWERYLKQSNSAE